jgi:DNA-binding GntR family transcriptional regulator
MSNRNFTLDLDRSLEMTLRQQAYTAIRDAIYTGRQGFRLGDRLTTSELSRHNGIHRNTLSYVMDDLVRQGYLRRLPNKGFEVIDQSPNRPPMLTEHILSVTEVARRNGMLSCSKLIPDECGIRSARDLTGYLARVREELGLSAKERVSVLGRCRLMKQPRETEWLLGAIEHSFIPTARIPDFLEVARHEIENEGDFSVYRQLRRAFPNDDFFKALYEISMLPLPPKLAAHWSSVEPPMNVLTITYCSEGPIEVTFTWFDVSRAVLLAGSLDVRLA